MNTQNLLSSLTPKTVLRWLALMMLAIAGTATSAIAQTSPIEGVQYTIMARHSKLMLDVLGRSQSEYARVSQYDDQKELGVQQKWIFETAASGQPNAFRIKNFNSGRYLAADYDLFLGYGGTQRYISQTALTYANESQVWCLRDAGKGFVRLQSCDSDVLRDFQPVYLDVIGQDIHNKASLGLYVQTAPGYQQMWKLTAVNAVTSQPIVVGKTILKWELYCQTTCNKEETEEVVTVNGTESTISTETKHSITNSIKGGFEYAGISAEASHEQTDETTNAQSEAKSFSESMGRSTKNIVKFDTDKFNIFTVWQWVAVNQMSDGTTLTVNSRKYSCRPDANPPTYLPGSPDDIQACHILRP